MKRAISLTCLILLLFINNFGQAPQKTTISPTKFTKLEDHIIDTIFRLSEVKRRISYVEKVTHNKRHIQIGIFSKPTKKEPYYLVEVMEDNGMAMHIHFNFYVYPKTLTIKYLDTANDDALLTLEQWRKSKDHPTQ